MPPALCARTSCDGDGAVSSPACGGGGFQKGKERRGSGAHGQQVLDNAVRSDRT